MLIGELATNHGGNLDTARRLIDYAVAGGATHIKTQAYQPASLNPKDPQFGWLRQAALTEDQHLELLEHCRQVGVPYFASVFDVASLTMLRRLGMDTFKLASSEAASNWWEPAPDETWYVSLPWGVGDGRRAPCCRVIHLAAIPLYPTPLEVIGKARLCGGWSDHVVGLAGCFYAIAHGASVVEVHVSLPGEGRQCPWDKTQEHLKQIRAWMNDCETIRSGVSQTFRDRWVR